MRNTIKRFLRLLGVESRKYIDCCFERDASIYTKYSGIQGNTIPVLAAKIRILCHTIEKALSLSDCRADFGKEKVPELISMYQFYKRSGGKDKDAIALAESIIHTYAAHRVSNGLDISFIPQELTKAHEADVKSGAMPFLSKVRDFENFDLIAHSRHSIRNFSQKKVSDEDIIKAVKIAQTAPSACNRQATRIYAITDPVKIDKLKQRHGGIRTFGQPGVIFAITQDLNLYTSEYERNIWLVDGGIFCMNLLYALNSVGIVNCPVIWGGMDDEDAIISELAGIPCNERTVILVVGGYAPEESVKTPCSAKRPVNDILHLAK